MKRAFYEGKCAALEAEAPCSAKSCLQLSAMLSCTFVHTHAAEARGPDVLHSPCLSVSRLSAPEQKPGKVYLLIGLMVRPCSWDISQIKARFFVALQLLHNKRVL